MTESIPDLTERTDETLMVAIQACDQDALAALAARYHTDVHAWAYWVLGDHHAAEDAVQDTLLAIWRFAHTYQPSRPFRVWLRTVAVNCARGRRKKDRGLVITSDCAEPMIEEDDPLTMLERKEAAGAALASTWNLEPRAREAIRLRFLEGLTYDEVADRLGVTQGAASGLIHRARKTLRLLLSDRFGEQSFRARERAPRERDWCR